jgi:hypothetical protein
MSFVIALKGMDSTVLAADGLAVREVPGGICKFECSKLRRVNRGRWVIGATGSEGVFGLIDAINHRRFDFGKDAFLGIESYARELWAMYQCRNLSGAMHFLLAGMDSNFPFIQRWSFDVPKPRRPISLIGPSLCDRDQEAIGVSGHGGLYFAVEYHREDMNTRQMVSLAHFCVSEVAKRELLVGGPVEIAIVNKNGAACLPDSKIAGLTARTESIAARLRSIFWEPWSGITPKALPNPELLLKPKALTHDNRIRR